MKVVIASQIAPRRIGSYERAHFGVARELERGGCEVRSCFSGRISGTVMDHFGLEPGSVFDGLGDPAEPEARRRWLDLLSRENPDVLWLHFFPIYGRFVLSLRRRLPRATICQTDRISRGPVDRGPLKSALHRARVAIHAGTIDLHIAVSRYIADRLVVSDLVPPDRVVTVHNGVDLDLFRPADSPGRHIASVAYMRAEKGVGVLLEALVELGRRGLHPPCKLVGDGPMLDEYRRYAGRAGLDRVEFTGLRDDVHEILRGAALTVVPSIWPEAFSNAAAESQACGVPVVASAVGGLPEVVEHGVTGLLVPPGRPEALTDAIESLLGDPGRLAAMGRAARQRAERLFGLRDKIDRTVRLLDPSFPLNRG